MAAFLSRRTRTSDLTGRSITVTPGSSVAVARKHDPDGSRTAILDAAEALFVDRGYAAIALSEIAERSGVTKSLIHHHFGSKEALWAEVKRRRFTSYHAQQLVLLTSGELSPATLKASMTAYFRLLLDNPPLVRLIGWMRLENDHDCADLVVELRTIGIRQIEAAQRANVIRQDIPPEHVLLVFVTLVNGYFQDSDFAANCQPVEAEAYLNTAWTVFAAGMLAQ